MSTDTTEFQWTIRGYIMQTCTSSISFISSFVIMVMIISSPAKLSSPYRRIIFGMSLADVFQSFALLIGPFALPKEATPELFWAVGNIVSCNVDGFLFVTGATIVPFYLLLLCLYYFCRLNLKMTDNTFTRKIEIKAHIFIVPYTIAISITALLLKTFNPLPGYERQTGSACYIHSYPAGCAKSPEIYGQCIRGKYAFLLAQFSTHGFFVICFIGVIILMGLLVRHAYWTEKMFRLNHESGDGSDKKWWPCFCCLNFDDFDQRKDESDANYVLRVYRRDTIIQASLYFTSFSILYTAMAVFYAKNVNDWPMPRTIYIIFSNFLYPLMGLFNIVIYTRPKIKKFRMVKPEYSWLKAFLLVVKAGGEVPDEESNEYAVTMCCKCWHVTNHHDGVSDLSNPTVSRKRLYNNLALNVASWGRRMRTSRKSNDVDAGSGSGSGSGKLKKKIQSNNNNNNNSSNSNFSTEDDDHRLSQVLGRQPDEKKKKGSIINDDSVELASAVAQKGVIASPTSSNPLHRLSQSFSYLFSTDDYNYNSNTNTNTNNSSNKSNQGIEYSSTTNKNEANMISIINENEASMISTSISLEGKKKDLEEEEEEDVFKDHDV